MRAAVCEECEGCYFLGHGKQILVFEFLYSYGAIFDELNDVYLSRNTTSLPIKINVVYLQEFLEEKIVFLSYKIINLMAE